MKDKALRLLMVAGTRPEAIKLAPVALDARRRRALAVRTLATGQHPDAFDEALAEFGLTPDRRLAPVPYSAEPDVMVSRLVKALLPVIAQEAPELVLVQGDTSSALAGAVAAHRLAIPVAHVEAGLRSGDLDNPYPEERNRIAIDGIARLLFAPTGHAAAALAREAAVRGTVLVSGNTGIDALLWMRARTRPLAPLPGRHRVLLTCHRRESFGAGIARICEAARRLAARGDVDLLCPLHSNPAAANAVRAMLGSTPGVRLTERLSYRVSVTEMAGARLILTDSGGIQEEAPALGVPALVLRAVTERPEGVAAGNLRVVGTDPDAIVAAASTLLDNPAAHAAMSRPAFPYGGGDAAARILDCVERVFRTRPDAHGDLPFAAGGVMDEARTGA